MSAHARTWAREQSTSRATAGPLQGLTQCSISLQPTSAPHCNHPPWNHTTQQTIFCSILHILCHFVHSNTSIIMFKQCTIPSLLHNTKFSNPTHPIDKHRHHNHYRHFVSLCICSAWASSLAFNIHKQSSATGGGWKWALIYLRFGYNTISINPRASCSSAPDFICTLPCLISCYPLLQPLFIPDLFACSTCSLTKVTKNSSLCYGMGRLCLQIGNNLLLFNLGAYLILPTKTENTTKNKIHINLDIAYNPQSRWMGVSPLCKIKTMNIHPFDRGPSISKTPSYNMQLCPFEYPSYWVKAIIWCSVAPWY